MVAATEMNLAGQVGPGPEGTRVDLCSFLE